MYDIAFVDIPNLKITQSDELNVIMHKYYDVCSKITYQKTGYDIEEKPFNYTFGLLCLGRYLKDKNFKVGYLNYNMNSEQYESFVRRTKVLCFSTMTITVNIIIKLAKDAKLINPKIKIIFGGYHASYTREELFQKCDCLDLIVMKEGEKQYIKYLNGVDINEIQGIAYRNGNNIITNDEEMPLEENEIPSPDFTLLGNDLAVYNIHMSTMRGCIGNCHFCVNHDYWGMPRMVSLQNLESDFAFLQKNLPADTLIHFSDNVFTYKTERLKQLRTIIKKYGKKFVYECDTLSSLIDKERVEILNDMKTIRIHLGFEDCVDNILRKANKYVNHMQNLNAIEIIANNAKHMCIYAYWLIGLPGANVDTLKINRNEIKRLLEEGKIDIVSPKIFIPYPGTIFFDFAKQFGITIKNKNWDEYERRTPPFPYGLDTLSSEDLYRELINVMKMCQEIYDDKLKNTNYYIT